MSPEPSQNCVDSFTLIELVSVIAILGLLTALLLPAIASRTTSWRHQQCRSRNCRRFGCSPGLFDGKQHLCLGRPLRRECDGHRTEQCNSTLSRTRTNYTRDGRIKKRHKRLSGSEFDHRQSNSVNPKSNRAGRSAHRHRKSSPHRHRPASVILAECVRSKRDKRPTKVSVHLWESYLSIIKTELAAMIRTLLSIKRSILSRSKNTLFTKRFALTPAAKPTLTAPTPSEGSPRSGSHRPMATLSI